MSYPHIDIIEQIKIERKKQGITQSELARLIGCPQPSIVRIETRKLSPTIGMLQKICDVLNMDIIIVKRRKIRKTLNIFFNGKDESKSFIKKSFDDYFYEITFSSYPTENKEKQYTEKELIQILENDESKCYERNGKEININVDDSFDFYLGNKVKEAWKIGNLVDDDLDKSVQRLMEDKIPATMLLKGITIKQLVNKYGDKESSNLYTLNEYKTHLIDKYLDEKYPISKEFDKILKNLK